MLSSSSQYAVRAVIYLAKETDESRKMRAEVIADALDIPKHFLAKILQQLTKAKIIASKKGRNGGFYLPDSSRDKSLLQVVETIDGPITMSQCILGLHNCSDANPCPYHKRVSQFRKDFYTQLENESIASCLDRIALTNLQITNENR